MPPTEPAVTMTKFSTSCRRTRVLLWAAGIAAGVGGGCMVGPNYQKPESKLPEAFPEVKPLPAGRAAGFTLSPGSGAEGAEIAEEDVRAFARIDRLKPAPPRIDG